MKKHFVFPKHSWNAVQRYGELAQVLVNRNLSVRYRGSILGIYWSLLSPLIMTGVYTAIFGAAFASFYDDSLLNYILAAFSGLVVINFFSASTSQALMSVVGNGALLNKMPLPMGVFPMSIVMANVFQFCAGPLPLLMLVAGLTSRSLLNVVTVILPFIALIMICLGVGYLVSGLYVFFRDLPYFYELITFALWITSPVFYPSEIVPDNVKPFLIFNPLTRIIESIRQIALSGDLPDVGLVAEAWLSGVVLLALGWFCFRWWKPQFMDLL